MFAIEEPISALAVSPITSEDEVSAPSMFIFVIAQLCFVAAARSFTSTGITPVLGDHRHRQRSHLHAAAAHAWRVVVGAADSTVFLLLELRWE